MNPLLTFLLPCLCLVLHCLPWDSECPWLGQRPAPRLAGPAPCNLSHIPSVRHGGLLWRGLQWHLLLDFCSEPASQMPTLHLHLDVTGAPHLTSSCPRHLPLSNLQRSASEPTAWPSDQRAVRGPSLTQMPKDCSNAILHLLTCSRNFSQAIPWLFCFHGTQPGPCCQHLMEITAPQPHGQWPLSCHSPQPS